MVRVDMAGKRCSACSLNFPNLTKYEKCLRCGCDTWFGQNVEPMSSGDLKEVEAEVEAVKQRAEGTNEQWLITYNDRQGQNANGEYRTELFFATAYTVEECQHQMRQYKRLHPESVDSVRAIVATGRPPKDGGPVAVNA